MTMLENVAKAICAVNWPDGNPDTDWQFFKHEAQAAIGAMRDHTLVFRQDGAVVHELRGAPDDIWKTLLDGILAEGEAG